ncbi:hypothetical protein HT031_005413 [Scenedesmus sp. PABB004]|nr:hypothetical protein HT031_005413 [Scenedesmus sp. PABB004]
MGAPTARSRRAASPCRGPHSAPSRRQAPRRAPRTAAPPVPRRARGGPLDGWDDVRSVWQELCEQHDVDTAAFGGIFVSEHALSVEEILRAAASMPRASLPAVWPTGDDFHAAGGAEHLHVFGRPVRPYDCQVCDKSVEHLAEQPYKKRRVCEGCYEAKVLLALPPNPAVPPGALSGEWQRFCHRCYKPHVLSEFAGDRATCSRHDGSKELWRPQRLEQELLRQQNLQQQQLLQRQLLLQQQQWQWQQLAAAGPAALAPAGALAGAPPPARPEQLLQFLGQPLQQQQQPPLQWEWPAGQQRQQQQHLGQQHMQSPAPPAAAGGLLALLAATPGPGGGGGAAAGPAALAPAGALAGAPPPARPEQLLQFLGQPLQQQQQPPLQWEWPAGQQRQQQQHLGQQHMQSPAPPAAPCPDALYWEWRGQQQEWQREQQQQQQQHKREVEKQRHKVAPPTAWRAWWC